jgi:hypothetical protein
MTFRRVHFTLELNIEVKFCYRFWMSVVVVEVGDHMGTLAPLLLAPRCTEPLAVQNLLS